MLAFIASAISGKLIVILAAAIGAVGLFFGIRRSDVKAQQTAALKTTLKHVEAANAAHDAVDRLPDDAVDHQLRSFYSRD